jgi:hypothetical protein
LSLILAKNLTLTEHSKGELNDSENVLVAETKDASEANRNMANGVLQVLLCAAVFVDFHTTSFVRRFLL